MTERNKLLVDDFYSLSQLLTGETKLPKTLAEEYYERIYDAYPLALTSLMGKYKKIATDSDVESSFKKTILKDPALSPPQSKALISFITQIISIWYTAQFVAADNSVRPPQTEEQYLSQLMYPLIHAPVRGYSKLQHGYWTVSPFKKP